jgi:GAF domain-containing protein
VRVDGGCSFLVERGLNNMADRGASILRGAMTIYRKEVQPFSASQVALLRHFAAQAVIAIENVRLFEQARSALRNSHCR